jgi:hypothetical protein
MKHGESIESLRLPLKGLSRTCEVLAVRRIAFLWAEYEPSSRHGINENL